MLIVKCDYIHQDTELLFCWLSIECDTISRRGVSRKVKYHLLYLRVKAKFSIPRMSSILFYPGENWILLAAMSFFYISKSFKMHCAWRGLQKGVR